MLLITSQGLSIMDSHQEEFIYFRIIGIVNANNYEEDSICSMACIQYTRYFSTKQSGHGGEL